MSDGVSVASTFAADAADEPGIGRQRFSDTAVHFVVVGWFRLEGNRCGLDDWAIEIRDCGNVCITGEANGWTHRVLL
jgi:hypothetical protein